MSSKHDHSFVEVRLWLPLKEVNNISEKSGCNQMLIKSLKEFVSLLASAIQQGSNHD